MIENKKINPEEITKFHEFLKPICEKILEEYKDPHENNSLRIFMEKIIFYSDKSDITNADFEYNHSYVDYYHPCLIELSKKEISDSFFDILNNKDWNIRDSSNVLSYNERKKIYKYFIELYIRYGKTPYYFDSFISFKGASQRMPKKYKEDLDIIIGKIQELEGD